MKELKKIKLSDITEQQVLNVDSLSKITGGSELRDGCKSTVCVNNRDVGTMYCKGGAVCTSGINTCVESTTTCDSRKSTTTTT